MNGSDPLANLRDIHLPGEIGWWPLATGWWLFIGVVILLLAWAVYKQIRHHQRSAILREVRVNLERIERDFSHSKDQKQLIREYSQLLRRLVMQHRGRQNGAAVTGNDWLGLLLQYQSATDEVDKQLNLLSEGQYQANPEIPNQEALGKWVSQCAEAICHQVIRGLRNA